jgi:hypothetical protein
MPKLPKIDEFYQFKWEEIMGGIQLIQKFLNFSISVVVLT